MDEGGVVKITEEEKPDAERERLEPVYFMVDGAGRFRRDGGRPLRRAITGASS